MNIPQILVTISIYAIPVLFAISLHEAAHGYVARYFGDPTAAEQGRISLNPIRHIDPFGTILLPLILYFATVPPLGYAKPVPVDFGRLRNPKKQMVFVALAGPMANFAMGLMWALLSILLAASGSPSAFLMAMTQVGMVVNAAMFVFNLIPIPPLDGGRVVTGLLPMALARRFASIERYSVFVFIGLIVLMQLRILDGYLGGGIALVRELFGLILSPLTLLLN
ncbi:site-2 protease family protein [Massilia sp. CF038]|uniref:site-2 protease family protein n=1 Tax=Massilia sp. CF038 TaxID=1881045 RepID=UPI00091CF495|nr:site-2 protease family protein [Massilia sp. CF038]SHG48210.1 Zn-dependent protease (includes SpoIVFB) [Massilia sp. CF038]